MDHLLTQFAGEVGLFSVGLGRNFKRYSIAGMYGQVPQTLGGGATIETVALRQTYQFTDWERLNFYGGLNLYHVLGLQYQSSKFRDTPAGYYSPGSIRALLNLGSGFQIDKKAYKTFYFEAGLNDLWIVNWLNNTDTIDPLDHVSLGLGFKFQL